MAGDSSFQDFEYPEYDDYRAEAFLHQQKRMECYSKAKEAYRMGKKNVATFYAQQVKWKTDYSLFTSSSSLKCLILTLSFGLTVVWEGI